MVTMPKIPKIPEIDVKSIWFEIRTDSEFSSYFPDYYITSKSAPDRTYFFTVS